MARLFHVDSPKTAKVREPTVESLVREFWRLRVSEAERSQSTGFLSYWLLTLAFQYIQQ